MRWIPALILALTAAAPSPNTALLDGSDLSAPPMARLKRTVTSPAPSHTITLSADVHFKAIEIAPTPHGPWTFACTSPLPSITLSERWTNTVTTTNAAAYFRAVRR